MALSANRAVTSSMSSNWFRSYSAPRIPYSTGLAWPWNTATSGPVPLATARISTLPVTRRTFRVMLLSGVK